ncbi:hypothetical protein AADZ90_021470 [Aestuariibius sp. 2305UL40-4]|uniref:hypothetical protein n=1 Tax=Aestuariibius violaceus TaxID=3234132 RepID=UPI00345EB924
MQSRRQTLALLTGCAAFTLFAPRSALAHHGFTGRYDDARPIYVEGIVRSASFRRPHPLIEMQVDYDLSTPAGLRQGQEFADVVEVREEDRGRIIDVEFPPVGLFFGLEGRIAAGDRIATIVFRNCRPPHQLRGQWIRLPDGEAVVRRGRMQTEEAGCSS